MDLEPKIVQVTSEEELISRAKEFLKAGRRVVDCNIFEEGVIGKLSFCVPPESKVPIDGWGTEKIDAIWLTWEKFGRRLQPEKIRIVDGNQMFSVFDEHRSHQIIGYTNSMEQAAGFVCFCRASEGKALVFFVDLANAKEIPLELLAALESPAEVIRP